MNHGIARSPRGLLAGLAPGETWTWDAERAGPALRALAEKCVVVSAPPLASPAIQLALTRYRLAVENLGIEMGQGSPSSVLEQHRARVADAEHHLIRLITEAE